MARNLRCLVCNRLVPKIGADGFGWLLSYPVEPGKHPRLSGYLVHEDCLRRIAHSDFDLGSDATGRKSPPD